MKPLDILLWSATAALLLVHLWCGYAVLMEP